MLYYHDKLTSKMAFSLVSQIIFHTVNITVEVSGRGAFMIVHITSKFILK